MKRTDIMKIDIKMQPETEKPKEQNTDKWSNVPIIHWTKQNTYRFEPNMNDERLYGYVFIEEEKWRIKSEKEE